MSLVCHNCGSDLGPSESFPGREGTMVYPQVLSLIWVAEEKTDKKWALSYVQAPEGRSLCFQCIAVKLPADRQNILNNIYAACEAEIKYRRRKELTNGKIFNNQELFASTDLVEDWRNKFKAVQINRCIFCGAEMPHGQNPHFNAVVIDRVYSEKNLSWFNQNYSWSDFKTGNSGFRFCFECCKGNFPAIFEQLSYDLRGIRRSTGAAKS